MTADVVEYGFTLKGSMEGYVVFRKEFFIRHVGIRFEVEIDQGMEAIIEVIDLFIAKIVESTPSNEVVIHLANHVKIG